MQGVATKGLRPDTQALRGAAQTVALQQVGRLLEAAGKAVETYDELAERGKVVVARYSGGTETVPGETADAEQGPVKVVVEQVFDEDEITEAPVESAEGGRRGLRGRDRAGSRRGVRGRRGRGGREGRQAGDPPQDRGRQAGGEEGHPAQEHHRAEDPALAQGLS